MKPVPLSEIVIRVDDTLVPFRTPKDPSGLVGPQRKFYRVMLLYMPLSIFDLDISRDNFSHFETDILFISKEL